ncbi:MAG: cysteine hydrolase family protein [Nitrospinota bacterium]
MELWKDAVLLVIDMQNTYLHPEGGLSRNGVDIAPMRSAIPAVLRLIQEGQARGLSGIYTRQIYFPQDEGMASKRIWPKTRRGQGSGSHGGVYDTPYALEGTWDAEIVEEIQPLIRPVPQDRVLDKPRYSAFYQTGLDNLLRVMGARTLIVCGVATNVCVDSTIRDAFFRNYDVLVVREAVASAQPDLNQAFLRNFDLFFGQVVGLEEILGPSLVESEQRVSAPGGNRG